jgi:hypothetical protein
MVHARMTGALGTLYFTRHCGMCKALLDCWLRPLFGSVGLGRGLDFAMRAYEIASLSSNRAFLVLRRHGSLFRFTCCTSDRGAMFFHDRDASPISLPTAYIKCPFSHLALASSLLTPHLPIIPKHFAHGAYENSFLASPQNSNRVKYASCLSLSLGIPKRMEDNAMPLALCNSKNCCNSMGWTDFRKEYTSRS